jgi:ferrochelatase
MREGLLVLGFGGPTPGCCGRRAACPRTPGCEAECFVSGILGDSGARGARVAEVTGHYQRFGGFSPYNALTSAQADALRAELSRRGREVEIACGYRHWNPWAKDALAQLRAKGCDRALALVMAPHQSSVSWDWYLKNAAEAVEALGAAAPPLVGVVEPWWDQPGFIEASAARIREATAGWTTQRFAAAELVFTAHAVPEPVSRTSRYCQQFAESARLIAAALDHPEHTLAYQSGPGDSRVAWTGPDIVDVVAASHAAGRRDLVVQAAGFLVDHTEVLYDLDVEAGAAAGRLGLGFTRARCVHDHPAFIALLADRVEQALARL